MAAAQLLAYIQSHIPQRGVALLAGNSVHADRSFLAVEPWNVVLEHLHYRLFDVSAMKEAVRRWGGGAEGEISRGEGEGDGLLGSWPEKKGLHTAREDILESIEEARWIKGIIENAARHS